MLQPCTPQTIVRDSSILTSPVPCLQPFDSYKALYFLEISARSLNTVSEHLNVSRSDVCDFLGNETFADEGSLELLEEDLDW